MTVSTALLPAGAADGEAASAKEVANAPRFPEAFFDCIVESFSDRGGQFATTRIDMCEPNQSLNGSTWIQDAQSGILEKSTIPLW